MLLLYSNIFSKVSAWLWLYLLCTLLSIYLFKALSLFKYTLGKAEYETHNEEENFDYDNCRK